MAQHSQPLSSEHLHRSSAERSLSQLSHRSPSTSIFACNGFSQPLTPIRPQQGNSTFISPLQLNTSTPFRLDPHRFVEDDSSSLTGDDDEDRLPIMLPPRPLHFSDDEDGGRSFVPINKMKPTLLFDENSSSECEREEDANDGFNSNMHTPPALEVGSPPTPTSPNTPPPFRTLGVHAPPSCRKLTNQLNSLMIQSHVLNTPRKAFRQSRRFADSDELDTSSSPIPQPSKRESHTPTRHQPMKRLLDSESLAESDSGDDHHRRRRTAALFDASTRGRHKGSVNVSRFKEEFELCEVLGQGEFGTVFKCRHRLDGVDYAIKRTNRPIVGQTDEKRQLREVLAHALLKVQPHIVRYYSSWEEDDHLLIQSEYCNGGSLEDEIRKRAKNADPFSEDALKELLHQIAAGLNSMHLQNLAHLDIKPGNILIQKQAEKLSPKRPTNKQSQTLFGSERMVLNDSAMTVDCASDTSILSDSVLGTPHQSPISSARMRTPQRPLASLTIQPVMTTTYKIADLGHATKLDDPSSVEDGDSRYLARELLDNDYSALHKADIFSLGLTMVEAATLRCLPPNGEEWHSYRNGTYLTLGNYSHAFHSLIQSMIHPDPDFRPSTEEILQHSIFVKDAHPLDDKSKDQLRQELLAEKAEKFLLQNELKLLKETAFKQSQMNLFSDTCATTSLNNNDILQSPQVLPRVVKVSRPKPKLGRAASVPSFL